MYYFPNTITIMSLTWLVGMAISVLYTVPLILLAKYHQSSSYVRKVIFSWSIKTLQCSVFPWNEKKLWPRLCDFGLPKLYGTVGYVACRIVFYNVLSYLGNVCLCKLF